MQLRAEQVTSVLTLGSSLATPDAERAVKMVRSVAPFSRLIVDFTRVRECHDAPFLHLINALKGLADVAVDLHGITQHHERLLKYLGHGTDAHFGRARNA